MKELIGQRIAKIFISDELEELHFVNTENTVFSYRTLGDCCNEVWFEHISGIEAIWGNIVKEFSTPKSFAWKEVEPTPGKDDFEEAGFFTLITDKGRCTIEVRNNHNGYYGGEVYFAGKHRLLTKEITEDF